LKQKYFAYHELRIGYGTFNVYLYDVINWKETTVSLFQEYSYNTQNEM